MQSSRFYTVIMLHDIKEMKKLFRFISLQAKGKSPFLPDFSCIWKTSKEI